LTARMFYRAAEVKIMKNIRYIVRADDLGSSNSANQAIEKVVDAGFVKNVSVMACGPYVESAAQLLAHRRDICFGMHMTLNAEWDRVKWGPVLPPEKCVGLVDEKGFFLSDPSLFLNTKPAVEVIMQEVSAQLERLHKLRFQISYIDSHMFPEVYVEGLDEAMAEFARQKGLLDHMYFYHSPPWKEVSSEEKMLLDVPDGQYFFGTHPSLNTEEMRMTGNASYSGEQVAASRAHETEILSDVDLCRRLLNAGVRGIRYSDAVYDRRLPAVYLTQGRSDA